MRVIVQGIEWLNEFMSTLGMVPIARTTRAKLKVNRKMKISGKQVKAARDLLGITQGELAKAAGLALNTISNFEAGKADPYQASLDKIIEELERRGIEFTNGTGIGVRLNYEKAEVFARADNSSVRKN